MKRICVLGAFCCVTLNVFGALPVVETRTESPIRSVLSISERVTRLEQQIGSPNTTLQLTQRLEALQQEVQELRGMVEDLKHLQPVSAVVFPTVVPASAEGENELYQTAYQQLQSRNYQAANQSLHSLLEEYPNGENTPNAYYWLGEIALIQGNTNEAQQYFETVISQFPTHLKVSDALLKKGYIAESNEDYPLAKQLLEQVIKQYPGSSAARLATARLQKMKKT